MRLGTRGSALALVQAEQVAKALGGAEIVTIRTSGDEGSPEAGDPGPGGDKARFVTEIERALLDGEIDLAVHSAKDLPTELPEGLAIAAVPAREDPRDAYVGAGDSIAELRDGARVGTSSLRRRAQILARRPDVEVVEMRGNVDTRLRKRDEQGLDGVVLAAAGLRRLGRGDEAAFAFAEDELTPAAGQGALAIEARADDDATTERLASLTDPQALARLICERAAVSALGADCDTPVAATAWVDSGRLHVRGFCGLPDGGEWIRDTAEGDTGDPAALGEDLAERMKGAGADDLLKRAAVMAEELGVAK